MKNLWSDVEARETVARYPGAGEDVALRVYTSRLLGGDPTLVMHGGGNTSVKGVHRDLFGDEVEAIYVKGSGWSLDTLEPAGLPGLDLRYLRRLRGVKSLSDEEMVNQLRTHLFDAGAPDPSVETLLHAFLPHKFVDHSHANVILALTNRNDGEELVRAALDDEVAIVPYVMPGCELAQAAADVADAHPGSRGLVLLQHGLFTWGDSAQESYEAHIDLVTKAEDFVAEHTGRRLTAPDSVPPDSILRARVAAVAPLIRGLLTRRDPERSWILDFRCTSAIRDLVSKEDLRPLLDTGPLTPDHVIRTKERPLVLPALGGEGAEAWLEEAGARLESFIADYQAYFAAQARAKGRADLTALDPLPRLVAVEGLGVFGLGANRKGAGIAADLYEHTAQVKVATRELGAYRALSPDDLFDVEYWSLEQKKLSRRAAPSLEGRVAVVTGAGGAIGTAICETLAAQGAAVVATDVDRVALDRVVQGVLASGEACIGIAADVSDEAEMAAVFAAACSELGGVDIVVLNAGIAKSAPIEDMALADWNRVVEINLTGYFVTLREAARLFRRQGCGGNVVVNASKNVFAPGAEFAAYSVSKSGGHQLGKLAAIELAPIGVRVNMVNPDAIFGHGELRSGLWDEIGDERARSRGLDLDGLENYYRQRNLLKTKISAADVARAVLFFAREETPTTGATLPVDGGIPEAFPR